MLTTENSINKLMDISHKQTLHSSWALPSATVSFLLSLETFGILTSHKQADK
jgi:hypothetical protein